MRWPIRNQIVLPFVAVVLVAVAGTSVAAAYLAANRTEDETVRRLYAVTQTLAQTNFPLTRSVLDKMRGLSGAHFVVFDEAGRVTESTLDSLDVPFDAFETLDLRRSGLAMGHDRLWFGGEGHYAAALGLQGRLGGGRLIVLYPESSMRGARWSAAWPPLAIGAFALVFIVAVAIWLAGRFSRRIRQVQRQVAEIAGGNFRAIEPGTRNDELRELVASVNDMCEQLRQMQQRIRQSERSHLIGQFAGGLAHQLRNAITGARLALQIHQQRCQPVRTDESLDVALRQLTLTQEQVNGLLSLGRQERMPPMPCDLGQLLGEVARLVRPACQHARVEFHHDLNLPAGVVIGCSDDLRAAILNLALNAIEAAGPGGAVGLRVIAEEATIRVEVSDSGAGPPPELAPAIFEPFVTGKPEGVGLGLALARQVACNHAGRLAWKRHENQTVFQLTLPVAAHPVGHHTGTIR